MDQSTRKYLDKQFSYFDKQFKKIDARFEQVDQRFDSMKKYIDYRFDELPHIFATKEDLEELSSKVYEYLDAFAEGFEESKQDREKYAQRFTIMDDQVHDHEVRIRTLERKK